MAVHQHLRCAIGIALRLLKHGKLIGIYRLIFMDPGLDVPTRKVSPIAAGKCSGAEAAHRNALPIAIVDIAGNARHAWIRQWQPQRAFPGGLRDCVSGPRCRSCGKAEHPRQRADRPSIQGVSFRFTRTETESQQQSRRARNSLAPARSIY